MQTMILPGLLTATLLGCASGGQMVTDQSEAPIEATAELTDVEPNRTIVLMVSFDGFRHDYMDLAATPNLDRLAAAGVKAEAMIPVFPVKTFPNHYSIATGLRPEHSGILNNTMVDQQTGKRYRISDRSAVEDPSWYSGEPIWNTAEKAGIRAGSYFWVGSETAVQGVQPTHWKQYDGSVPNGTRIDSILSWMSSGDDRQIDLGVMYFSLTDDVGHAEGTLGAPIRSAIATIDSLVGVLVQGLRDAGLYEQTTLVFVSDHGMADYSADEIIILDDIIDVRRVQLINQGPLASMNVADSTSRQEIYTALRDHPSSEFYEVYLKEDLPAEWSFGESPRADDLYIVPASGYLVMIRQGAQYMEARLPEGGHGYRPDDQDMKAFFLASGPGLRKGVMIPEFANVNVYGLLCHLLGIEPAPYDGDPEWVWTVVE